MNSCYAEVGFLNKTGPKILSSNSSRSVLEDVSFNRAVALAKGDIKEKKSKKAGSP